MHDLETTAYDMDFDTPWEIDSLKAGDLTSRLAEMGCVPGTEITKLYNAPGGDPIAFQIDSYILGLRKSEAQQILIRPINQS